MKRHLRYYYKVQDKLMDDDPKPVTPEDEPNDGHPEKPPKG